MGTRIFGACATALLPAALLGWGAAASADMHEGGTAEGRGAQIYQEFCASCHGRYGRGDGPLAASVQVPLPDFTDSRWLAGRSAEQIQKGLMGASHGPMAIATVFDEDSLRDAIGYIRTLSVSGQHVSVKQGEDIYNATCWACHGREGNGKGPAVKNLMGKQPRDFTDPNFVIEGREDEIAKVISLGAEAAMHGSSFMPAWGSHLSEQQIRDLIAYLKTFQSK